MHTVNRIELKSYYVVHIESIKVIRRLAFVPRSVLHQITRAHTDTSVCETLVCAVFRLLRTPAWGPPVEVYWMTNSSLGGVRVFMKYIQTLLT